MKIYRNSYAMGLTYAVYDTETKEVSHIHRDKVPVEREMLFHCMPTATTEKWFLESIFGENDSIMAYFGDSSYVVELGQREKIEKKCIAMGGDKEQERMLQERKNRL